MRKGKGGRMMYNIMFDTLQFFSAYEGGMFIEGYNGFRVEEGKDESLFIIYKEIANNDIIERRFILPKEYTLNDFIREKNRLDNIMERQKFLQQASLAVEEKMIGGVEENLKEFCDEFYEQPNNYFRFVCINFTKRQFYSFVKERIMRPALALVEVN
jgi:hypothetical protein